MPNLEKAIKRIKRLQCPTGELEDRVTSILEDYRVGARHEISIDRNDGFYRDEEWSDQWDKDGTEAYRVRISNKASPSITVIARSGHDDYVAQVVDVYLN